MLSDAMGPLQSYYGAMEKFVHATKGVIAAT